MWKYVRFLVSFYQGATKTFVSDTAPLPTKIAHALVTEPHDEIVLSNYTTDDQPQTATYKKATVTVATVTLTYSNGAAGGNLLSAVKS